MPKNAPLAPFGTVRSTNGMVASIDHLASGAGITMLRAGGSAADAAVAASAVLAVTAQHTCGMGGDVWALVHHTSGEPPAALNASGRAGSGADPQTLRDEGHVAMPVVGDPRSIPVPGCVDGWLALHDRFGRLPLAQILEPAIGLAEDGFPLSPAAAAAAKRLADVPNADDYFGAPKAGTVIRRPGVARALRAICKDGRAGFYQGEFGEDLLALGQPQDGQTNRAAEYHESDLAVPLADWVEPLQIDAWEHRIWTVPPNSQGYLTLAGAGIAAALDVPADIDDPLAVHLLAEAAKQVAYDRIDVLHEHADGNELLAPDRLHARQAAISPTAVSSVGAWPQRSGDTNYLAAVDADRMGVSLIQSNASGWGAHCFTARTRISLQNRGIGFSLQPGHAAEYGPGRRPPHTLAPALVQTPDGALRSVLGTMGGDNQPQVVLQLLARLLHGGANAGEAIAAGRWYWTQPGASLFETWASMATQHNPVPQQSPAPLQLVLEGHAGTDALQDDLAARGHDVMRSRSFEDSFGHAHVIMVNDAQSGSATRGGVLCGASDPRMLTSSAQGY